MESCRGDDEESDPDDRHKVYEATVYNRQGKAHQIEYSMVPSLEELDPIFAVLIRDISERKALHLRMLQVDRLVAVGTLAAGVVHEIKNPLTYVMNNIYLAQEAAAYLGEAVDDKSDTQVLVDEINTSLSAANGGISRVRHIVDDMRVFAHSDPGARRPIATERAIELALRMTRGEVRRVARIETDMDETAPVFAEPTRLSQVFVNLMTNAAHAMAQIDADDHVLTIEVKERDDWVVARFCDTGPGFDEQVQERIFEPFFTTKSADEGTGLGLSLSKAIVEGFDGHIDVDSPPGQGAIFEVWLPIYREVEQSHS